jgi:CelD/BcsL family acetyltransferase involved in cellulose biosynthesis
MKLQRRDTTVPTDAAKIHYTLGPAPDAMALRAMWHTLEARADGSFFQSWGWVGTWYAALPRTAPVLLFTAARGGEIICLGLLVRKGGKRHFLTEVGDRPLDELTIEHNGMLVDRRSLPLLTTDLLPALLALLPPKAELVASGVPQAYLDAPVVDGFCREVKAAKTVHIAQLQDLAEDCLSSLSNSTQAKLRHSLRRYAHLGEIRLTEARDVKEAIAFFEGLAGFHQSYWQGRGKRGAFASSISRQFHQAMIENSFAERGIQLLHVTAGTASIGYLYNLRYRGRIYAYQSGFDYTLVATARPGFLCHWLALRHNQHEGALAYDFLAGTNQMKQAFANRSETLYWLQFRRRNLLYAIESGLRSTKRAALALSRSARNRPYMSR